MRERGGGGKGRCVVTFMTGAQKCTVLMPIGLSHMRLIQLCWGPSAAPPAVLCHLRLHSWRRYALRNGDARWKAWRVWKAADVDEKSGRDARAKVDEGGIFGLFFFFWSFPGGGGGGGGGEW